MRKNILLWSLYDFANSIIMIAFLFYFSQWLVVDSSKPDWWYNVTLIVSSAIFIILAPFLAYRLDRSKKKLRGVKVTSIIFTLLYIATALVMLFAPTHALLATILFTLSMSGYLLSFTYYTPMINDISDESNRGWVSGLGQGANYLGQVAGLFVTLPFATGAVYLFGAPGRAQALVPAIILFVIFALPFLLWFKEPTVSASTATMSGMSGYRDIWHTTKRIFSIRNLALLFLGYFLFSDALLTFSNNFPIFLEKVFAVSDSTKAYLSAAILICSAIGGPIAGKIADRKGKKVTLIALLIGWAILFPLLAFAPSFTFAVVIMVIAGFFYGPVWGVSRAMVSEYTPREIESSSFGFYIVAERFATFVGPIVWSLVLARTVSQGSISYSYAITAMGVLILVALIFVGRIRPRTL